MKNRILNILILNTILMIINFFAHSLMINIIVLILGVYALYLMYKKEG